MALVLTITAAGRAALVNAQNTGTAPVTIAQVGVSAQAIAPTAATAALPGEIKRIDTLSGDVVAEDTIHLIVRDETSDLYAIRSFALYLADGTLFAAYGQADPIMEKSAQSLLLLAIDVRFVDIDAANLTFGDATFLNPPATVDRQGVVELATDAEATDGTDPVRALTPRGAKAAVTAWLNSRFGDGAPSAFVKGLLVSASAVAFRASLAIKSAALKDEGAGNGLDSDLLDGQQGAWYADIPARLGYTPWHLNNDGAGSGLDADLLDGRDGSAYALLAGSAFTGHVSAPSIRATGAAVQSGNGAQLFMSAGNGWLQSYDFGAAAYRGLYLSGSPVSIDVAGTVRGNFTGTGLAVTGQVNASAGLRATGVQTAFAGGGVGIQYNAGLAGGTGFISAYDYATAAFKDLNLEGTTVALRPGGANVAVASSTGLTVDGALTNTGHAVFGGGAQTATYRVTVNSAAGLGLVVNTVGATFGLPALNLFDGTVNACLSRNGTDFAIGTFSAHDVTVRTTNVERARINAAGLAVTGNVSATGGIKGGAIQTTGSTGIDAAAAGGEFYYGGDGRVALQAYNRGGAAYLPLDLRASQILLKYRDTTVANIGSTGIAVTGTISATADISTTGALIASGAVVAGGLVDGQTPNISTTGGVRIRGNQTSGMAYLQFTDAPATAQWGYFSCNAAGLLTWGGNTLWHAGNDGSGSGLDADLLDGQHGNWWRDWNNLLNKPASFPPSAHQHLAADIAGAFAGSITQNGWVVLPNGLIIQWGRFSAGPNTTTRVSFPMTFPSAGFAVSPNAGASGGADSSDNPPVLLGGTIDQFGFTVFSADDSTCSGAYIAIGY